MSKWISDAYIKRLLQNNRLLQGNCEYKLWEQEVEKTVDAMPSIDIEPKRGEWKPFDLTWGRSVWYCTACEESTEVPCDIWTHKPIYNFCPNCGADMRKGV